MFEHFQIEIKFSKLRNFEEYKMFDKEYKFSFEMFWKNYKKLIYIKMIYNWSVKFQIRELNSGILKLVLRFWKIYKNNTI